MTVYHRLWYTSSIGLYYLHEEVKILYKGVRLRLYPSKEQQNTLYQMFGNDRFVWNQMLNMLQERYKNNHELDFPSNFALNNLLVPLKKEYPFLQVSNAQGLQLIVKNLNQAYKDFFKHKRGYPKFKSKNYARQSCAYPIQNGYNILAKHLVKLPKLGIVKTSKTGVLQNQDIKRVTISTDNTGRYYLSFLVKFESQELPKTKKQVGIDLGVKDLAILSSGLKYKAFKQSKLERQIRLEQRKYSRKLERAKKEIAFDKHEKLLYVRELGDFKNLQKSKQRLAILHAKLANRRKDYLHKITHELVTKYDILVIEDLKTNNMLKNHKLAHSISSQSWRMLREQLSYKCEWYDKDLMIVSPYKTSQVCSSCGYDDGKHTLDIRQWTCPSCGQVHDRDINAAKNILTKGLG